MSDARHLFATPLIADTLKSEAGIAALREAVEAERARDATGVSISNVGGWHSNTNMLEWGGEAARALAGKAIEMADAATLDNKADPAKPFAQGRYGWHPEMWANVSGRGNSNQYHTHPGSFWSAVAYIDDGYDGSTDQTLGGELQLLDPRMPMIRMTAPDLRFRGGDGKAMHTEIGLRPRTGLIVMFPSWLQHAVRPFHGSGTRISIAINLVPARQADGAEPSLH